MEKIHFSARTIGKICLNDQFNYQVSFDEKKSVFDYGDSYNLYTTHCWFSAEYCN